LDVLARRDSAPDLKTILVGGDALTRGLAFKALDQLPHLALINVYGTTETGCDSTFYKITRDEIDEAIPVGEPLPGVGITIRDTNGDVLPRGVAGEVCIEGDAVGRGYIRHSDKNRFSSVDGTRRFMSRDQGLLDAEGRLHILGRMDNEVKINGYRVDLNGVANAISRFRSGGFEIRPSDLTAVESARQCESCGLTETHPGVTFENQICSVCDGYAKSQEVYDRYFGEGLDGLKNALGAPGALGTAYDCMLLYSGGKDSSYVLYRLIEMGYKVLAFTFDNGHISKAAFKNIARQTKRLGVDSHVEGLQQMDAVFLESLFEESTVCSGCFKALTATSTRLAADLGIPAVLTGLSRGQIAETKLERLINGGVSDIDELERQLVMMRTLYHSAADSANALIDINLEDVDLSAIAFLDYFRYDPVQTRQVREYLSERDDYWAQPKDTGFCSSNCMINDSGVCVHLRNRRFHNYASPLAWDLRLAVVDPDEMQAELRSDIPVKGVNKLLRKLGYFEAIIKDVVVDVVDAPNGGKALCAYYVAESEISFEAMRNHLTRLLPSYMIPLFFVPCKSIPLTTSGKPDRSAFPSLSQAIGMSVEYAAAETAAEQALVGIWQEVLHLDKIGIDDPFFSLGGKSLDLFEVQKLLEERHGWDFDIVDMFELETIRKIASNLKVNPQTAPKEVVFEV
jgi:AMP-binding enzyme/Phosphopantetheine attachment site/Queuosine biosynthesis protein QueC